ncbi:MAG TPA: NAD(P)/FAD-dependent oxidoreductase [Clostridia bacterium]|nr:NAD(P)/FAD-dependent oxidoreductase [Clostridia bacterium]
MKTYDVAVIGAGASGLCAAINCARGNENSNIIVIEHLQRVGKKILATGNGRCNLTNINASEHPYNNFAFAQHALNKFNVEKTLAFFESLGLFTVTDNEGRVYPMSNTAASVLDVLRFEVSRLGIETLCGFHVDNVQFKNDKYIINDKIVASRVIIACAGKAAPSHGSDGSGFEILKKLGYNITTLSPALVKLKTERDKIKPLKGIRAKVDLEVIINDKPCAKSSGEILFTDYGVSGIAAMDTSRCVAQHFANDKSGECKLIIDFAPSFNKEEITDILKSIITHNPNLPIETVLIGVVPKAVCVAVCKTVGLSGLSKPVKTLDSSFVEKVAETLKRFELNVVGTKGYVSAQVTAGGVDVNQFNQKTLESKKHKGLYCCGEILDVDGSCGGFNLQWAWSSGLLAGENASIKE